MEHKPPTIFFCHSGERQWNPNPSTFSTGTPLRDKGTPTDFQQTNRHLVKRQWNPKPKKWRLSGDRCLLPPGTPPTTPHGAVRRRMPSPHTAEVQHVLHPPPSADTERALTRNSRPSIQQPPQTWREPRPVAHRQEFGPHGCERPQSYFILYH